MEDEKQPPTLAGRVWRVVRWPLAVTLAALIGLVVYWGFWPYQSPAGTGFVYYNADAQGILPRTLWDWLGLLIVPAALAVGAYWFNRTQKETELKIAEKARAAEQDIAQSRQRQATLEAYYDRMTDLLLNHNLRTSEAGSEVRSIARARTIAVVRSLDGERNRQLFAFLRASKLLDWKSPVVDLSWADLSNVELIGVDLSRVDLSKADLSGANLSKADLRGTNLSEADLSGANLSQTFLFESNLFSAVLVEANLCGSNLNGANLTDANIYGASLSGAVSVRAVLSGVGLTMANLSRAYMSEATGWVFERFDSAANLEAATMPDGVQLGTLGDEGLTYDEWKAQYLAGQGEE